MLSVSEPEPLVIVSAVIERAAFTSTSLAPAAINSAEVITRVVSSFTAVSTTFAAVGASLLPVTCTTTLAEDRAEPLSRTVYWKFAVYVVPASRLSGAVKLYPPSAARRITIPSTVVIWNPSAVLRPVAVTELLTLTTSSVSLISVSVSLANRLPTKAAAASSLVLIESAAATTPSFSPVIVTLTVAVVDAAPSVTV